MGIIRMLIMLLCTLSMVWLIFQVDKGVDRSVVLFAEIFCLDRVMYWGSKI